MAMCLIADRKEIIGCYKLFRLEVRGDFIALLGILNNPSWRFLYTFARRI